MFEEWKRKIYVTGLSEHYSTGSTSSNRNDEGHMMCPLVGGADGERRV